MMVQFFWGLAAGLATSFITGRFLVRSVEQSADPVKGLAKGLMFYLIRLGIDAVVLFGAYFLGAQMYGLIGIATGLVTGNWFWLLLQQLRLKRGTSAGKGGRR